MFLQTKFVKIENPLQKLFLLFANFSLRLANFILYFKKNGYKIVCKKIFLVYKKGNIDFENCLFGEVHEIMFPFFCTNITVGDL